MIASAAYNSAANKTQKAGDQLERFRMQPTTEQTTTAHTAVSASHKSNSEAKPKATPPAHKKFHKDLRRKEEKLKASMWLFLGVLTFGAIALDQFVHFLEQIVRLTRELIATLGL